MDTNRYKVFLKIVECGSFSQAAELTHYSQSGISRLIAELESEMGVKLLERGRAGVRLTSDGQMLMPRLKSVADELDRLQNSVDELNGLESGIIRIGVFRASRHTGCRGLSSVSKWTFLASTTSCCSAITPRLRNGSRAGGSIAAFSDCRHDPNLTLSFWSRIG